MAELKGRVLTAANHKGGVGKTTLVVTLAEALAKKIQEREKRTAKILVVDMDGQGNTARVLSIDRQLPEKSIHDVLLDRSDKVIHDAIRPSKIEGVFHLPSRLKINNHGYVEEMRSIAPNPFKVLRRRLEPVRRNYDYILIDTRPALDMLTLNGLAVADYYLIPFLSGDIYALDGMDDLSNIVETMILDREVNPDLKFMGAVLQAHSSQHRVCKVTEELIGEAYTIVGSIPMSTKVKQATMNENTIISYDPTSPASQAYFDLAETIMGCDA